VLLRRGSPGTCPVRQNESAFFPWELSYLCYPHCGATASPFLCWAYACLTARAICSLPSWLSGLVECTNKFLWRWVYISTTSVYVGSRNVGINGVLFGHRLSQGSARCVRPSSQSPVQNEKPPSLVYIPHFAATAVTNLGWPDHQTLPPILLRLPKPAPPRNSPESCPFRSPSPRYRPAAA
jgi:hypothetical protein